MCSSNDLIFSISHISTDTMSTNFSSHISPTNQNTMTYDVHCQRFWRSELFGYFRDNGFLYIGSQRILTDSRCQWCLQVITSVPLKGLRWKPYVLGLMARNKYQKLSRSLFCKLYRVYRLHTVLFCCCFCFRSFFISEEIILSDYLFCQNVTGYTENKTENKPENNTTITRRTLESSESTATPTVYNTFTCSKTIFFLKVLLMGNVWFFFFF